MNSGLPVNVTEYLSKYGDDRWKLEVKDRSKFNCAIIIPAIAEYENIIKLLHSLAENKTDPDCKTILIFVVNSTVSSGPEIRKDNGKTIALLRSIMGKKSEYHTLAGKLNSSAFTVGLVDASSEGFEMPGKTGGVGLARKIGMDLALTILDYQSDRKKIFICLDADCTVEKNYVAEIFNFFNSGNIKVALVNFEHEIPEDEEKVKAIICYEIFLRYYALGLKYAGSVYGFPAVGSTMACDYEAYIKVEGMNKRKAAEDFYFLGKLAKHYNIGRITSSKVFPSARASWRVPFGTGQSITRFLSKARNEYLLYDPECFNILKKWLKVFYSGKFPGIEFLRKAEEIHPELSYFLLNQNFKDDWDKILLNSKNNHQLNRQKTVWFDSFRTLKLIHHLRDTAFPLIDMFDALDIFLRLNNISPVIRNEKIPDVPVQLKYLTIFRNL